MLKPASTVRPASPEPITPEPVEPLSMLAIMEDSARALHELATIASTRLKDKLAQAVDADDMTEATALLGEALRLRDRALAAAQAAAPYAHPKLASTDSAAPASSVPKFDYAHVIETTNDPHEAMSAYLKLVDGNGIVNSAAPPDKKSGALSKDNAPERSQSGAAKYRPPVSPPAVVRRTLADAILDEPQQSAPPAREPHTEPTISDGLKAWSRRDGRNRTMT